MNARSRSRSVALALLIVVAVAGIGTAGALAAGSGPSLDLASVTPSTLLASTLRVAESGRPVSGTVSSHVDLGLPDIPSSMGGGPSGIESVLGDQRFKVWSSPDGLRVAQLLPYAERVFVGSRTDLWTWNSDTDLAVHTPVDPAMNRAASRAREQILGNPVDLAARILRAVSNVAEVSVGAPQEVAGRATYTLRLAPLSQVIKIGEIDVAIDAETRVPLRVEVFPRGSMDPAINVGFSSVDFGPIDPGMFSFTPPPGAAVRQASLPDPLSTHGYASSTEARPAEGTGGSAPQDPAPRTFGSGFGLVLAVPVQASRLQGLDSILPFEGTLGSAEIVQRSGTSWLLAGAVNLATLSDTASKLS